MTSMKYDELVKALRCGTNKADKNHNCEKCRYFSCNNCLCTIIMDDAAAAIEALSKTVKDLTTKVECSPMQISGKAFDRAIEAWNEKARKAVQDA